MGRSPRQTGGKTKNPGNGATAEALLDEFLASSPLAGVLLDERGIIFRVNQAAVSLFGMERAQCEGAPFAIFCADPAHQDILTRLLTGALDQLDIDLRRAGGEIFPAHLAGVRLSQGLGRLIWIENVGAIAKARQDWQKLQEQSERSALAKTTFLATMSHEIRTPMNGMIGMLELLEQSSLSPEQREMIEVIQESGRTLLSITDEILDLSKIEAGKLLLENVSFRLRQLIEDIIELLANKARAKGLQLAWWADPSLPDHFFGDPTRLKQICLNLLSNAVKFTPTGSVILRLHRLGGPDDRPILRFEVTDTGIGLSPEQQTRLFQPFEQADKSTMRNFGGTGLGLSICHRLTELMGGTIGVVSALGAGSSFWAEIPLAVDGSPRRSSQDLAGLTILVMDILPEARATIGNQLRSEGAQILEAADPQSAEELLDCFRLDLALVGLSEGLETLVTKLLQLLPPQRIIISQMVAHDAQLQWCQARGLAPPLLQPLRKKQLMRALAVALDRSHPSEFIYGQGLSLPHDMIANAEILVAEDNAINRLVLTKQLRQLGFTCDMAEHGEAAWAMLQQKPYQLLISDCIMPVLDGFELARRIRRAEAREGGHLRIIALTANVVEGEEEKCRSAGMDDYAGKPLTLDRLARLLHNQFHGDEAALASLGDQRDGLATGSDPIDWAALSAILGSEDPSDLREVANFFAVSFGGLLDELDKAMAAGDSDLVVRAAHSAKGAARNGAAPILATLMNKIEMAARDGGITILQPIVAAARDEFSRLEEWLRAG